MKKASIAFATFAIIAITVSYFSGVTQQADQQPVGYGSSVQLADQQPVGYSVVTMV